MLALLASCLSSSLFAFFLSLFLIFFIVSVAFLSLPSRRSFFFLSPFCVPFSLSLPLPPCLPSSFALSPFPFRHPCDAAHTRAPHYHARESRARYNTHGRSAALILAECAVLPPLQGTVSRGPQAATARSAQHGLCSLVSRAHDSQRRTERPDRQIALSLPGSACSAFSLPLSLSSFLLSPFSPFFALSPRACPV